MLSTLSIKLAKTFIYYAAMDYPFQYPLQQFITVSM